MLIKPVLEIENIIRYAKSIEQTFIEDENLSLLQFEALYYLSQNDTTTVTDLSINLDTSAASASVLIDRLVKKNLVIRKYTDSDRRKVHVSLSDYGFREALRFAKKKQDVISVEQFLLSEDETLLLNKLFAKLTK